MIGNKAFIVRSSAQENRVHSGAERKLAETHTRASPRRHRRHVLILCVQGVKHRQSHWPPEPANVLIQSSFTMQQNK